MLVNLNIGATILRVFSISVTITSGIRAFLTSWLKAPDSNCGRNVDEAKLMEITEQLKTMTEIIQHQGVQYTQQVVSSKDWEQRIVERFENVMEVINERLRQQKAKKFKEHQVWGKNSRLQLMEPGST